MSTVKASVSLGTFAFINLVLFIVLSSPISSIFSMLDDEAENHGVQADTAQLIENFRIVFGLIFVLSMVGLIIWFLLGSHEEEFEEYSR